MTEWVAVCRGALDVSAVEGFAGTAEVLVTPVAPSVPMALFGDGARVWRRLVAEGPVSEDALSEADREIVSVMAEMGIVSDDAESRHRLRQLDEPWLSSPIHELVYALVSSVCDDLDVRAVFIKGPMLHRQGLRSREHSGDVDVWVQPSSVGLLASALEKWGWVVRPAGPAHGTMLSHSETLLTGQWGAEVDLHWRFPGLTRTDDAQFTFVVRDSATVGFGGFGCLTPSVSANAVIQALHLIRPPSSSVQFEQAVFGLRAAGRATVAVAEEWGALPVAASALRSAFPDEEIDASGRFPRVWTYYRMRSSSAAATLFAALLATRGIDRLRIVRGVFWPSKRYLEFLATNSGLDSTSRSRSSFRWWFGEAP